MAKMTPEQEAAYALDFGVARSDLPPEAQLAYDRLVEQRARARAQAPVAQADAEATSAPVVMPRWVAAVGTAVFALDSSGDRGCAAAVRVHPLVTGHASMAGGGADHRCGPDRGGWPSWLAWAFAQFAAEGIGVPIPGEPNSQRLTVGGPYRYVRNPLYVASVVAISGQALLLSRPVLLVYAAAFLAITFVLVHWIEDPALARRFGGQFEDYRKQVPGWWPRWPRRSP